MIKQTRMSNRVVITGIGLVTPLGVGSKVNWNNILSSRSGLISTTSLPDYEESGWNSIPSKVIGKVPSGSIKDGKWNVEEHMDAGEARRLALFSQYGVVASQEALNDAKWFPRTLEEKKRTGIAVGSGIGSFQDIYENAVNYNSNGYRKVQPLFIPKILANMAAGNISIKFGLEGPNHAVSTACATGLHAVGDAYNFIRNGYAEVMVAGGTEASIHPLALAGFARARSVVTSFNDEPVKASRPFDKDRNGFVLSEGCGILILESLDHALRRGLKDSDIYSEVLGYGLSGDASHITAPKDDGDGAYRAMEMALKFAKVHPLDVDYINAHATSTVIGDRAENNAISSLFKCNEKLSISSVKSSMGHLLGAAGAVELIFTVMAIKNGKIPPTLNLENLGGHTEDDKDSYLRFDYVPHVSIEKNVNYALSNSFGFGGVNASVCFGKYK